MPITHEQKADIGEKYIAHIKDRIKTREAAQERASHESKILDDNSDLLMEMGRKIADKFKITRNIEKSRLDSEGYRNDDKEYFYLTFTGDIRLIVPSPTEPALKSAKEAARKSKQLSRDLCAEIEFLTACLAPTRIASFQASTARLWAPKTKDTRLGQTELNEFVNNFLLPARSATCAL